MWLSSLFLGVKCGQYKQLSGAFEIVEISFAIKALISHNEIYYRKMSISCAKWSFRYKLFTKSIQIIFLKTIEARLKLKFVSFARVKRRKL